MSNARTVERTAVSFGGSFEDDDETMDWYLYTPQGFVWISSGTSTIVIPYGNVATGQKWIGKAALEAAERMQTGVESAPVDYEGGWWEE